MAGLQEQALWDAEIYQIEQTDPVVGGPPNLAQGQGITNVPHQALANRTAWLKAQVEALQTALANIDVSADVQAAIDALIDGAPGALDTLNELAQAVQDNDGEIAAALSQLATAMNGANNLSEITDPAAARANIGAGTGVPLGAIAAFHQTVAPAGWLICDGSPVTALYPELRAHLLAQAGVQVDGNGDPLLPDFRGEFLRGLDGGRGVDAARVLGSAQSDDFKEHQHGIISNTGGSELHGTQFQIAQIGGTGQGDEKTVDDGTTLVGGSETRPRNVAALICMKAFDAVQPEGMADLSALLSAIATQVQAEQGVNTTALMTPERTKQAIEAIPNGLGVGQVAQDVSGSRAANTAYQNASGKPVFVVIRPSGAGGNRNFQVSTDAVTWVTTSVSGGTEAYTQSCVVPPGHFYRFTGAFGYWVEVR